MATKTFKIGLSATDKQNMAQDIYEQVEELLFEEYDSTKTYNENDYVVYSGVLYRALVDNITGTWDGTKWTSATLNDLVDDVNGAVESVDNKANVNGNYPTMTVGLADNLTPYGEDSGAEQDNPFISNGTGTNNNTEIVTVGDYGLLKEKQGNTLVVNQKLQNGNFESTSGWSTQNATLSVANNVGTMLATAQYGQIKHELPNVISGHKYLILVDIKTTTATTSVLISLYLVNDYINKSISSTTNKQTISYIGTPNQNGTYVLMVIDDRTSGWDNINVSNVCIIDLTQMFNGDIPQDLLDNPSHFSWYYNGSLAYNTGSLVNASGVKLVSTGRNLWDEEWEVGLIDNTTGQNESNANAVRSKNYINIVPNVDYYFKVPIGTSNWFRVCWYDKNKTFISGLQTTSFIQKSPTNACYMRFCSNGTYGNTYLNDITISLYYTEQQGGEGYSTYYPHEEPNVINTGSEVLRSAGSVKDYKEPNGTIHRLVDVVDFETLDWEYLSSWGTGSIMKVNLPLAKKPSSNNVNFVGKCDKYSITNISSLYANTSGKQIALTYDGVLVVVATSNSDIPTGTLNYELATPTTEQGTAFSENLPINDYGMLYWLNEDNELVGIPQGAKIFFPTNYKGFVDDMYSRVEGDSSQYVIQSELSASETARDSVDTQLLNAIGGTLRQILASSQSIDFLNTKVIDLSTLTFVRVASRTHPFFYADISDAKTEGKCLTTMYKSIPSVGGATFGDNANNMECCLGMNSSQVIIRNDSYTDTTAFKNAMKGVLLAYEKA